jgi:hypothetical protein
MNIMYTVTDSGNSTDWTAVGTNFARSGMLQITTTSTSASLTDTSTEINNGGYFLSFSATLTGSNIVISYQHNYTSNLILCCTVPTPGSGSYSESTQWAPF